MGGKVPAEQHFNWNREAQDALELGQEKPSAIGKAT